VGDPVGEPISQRQDDCCPEGMTDQDELVCHRQLRDDPANALGKGERGEVAGAGALSRQIDGDSGEGQKRDHVVPHPPASLTPMHQDKRSSRFAHPQALRRRT
jgi:hypothetical protein